MTCFKRLILPQIFPSARIILIRPAYEQNVDNQIDRDNHACGDQVLLMLGRVVQTLPDVRLEGVEDDPQRQLGRPQEESEEEDAGPNLTTFALIH